MIHLKHSVNFTLVRFSYSLFVSFFLLAVACLPACLLFFLGDAEVRLRERESERGTLTETEEKRKKNRAAYICPVPIALVYEDYDLFVAERLG